MNSLNVAYNCIYEVYHLHQRFHVIVQVLYCIQTYYAYNTQIECTYYTNDTYLYSNIYERVDKLILLTVESSD